MFTLTRSVLHNSYKDPFYDTDIKCQLFSIICHVT